MLHTNYSLRRHRLNRQGYDSSGAYWGSGNPLYVLEFRADGHTSTESAFFRAASRDIAMDKAKAEIASHYRAHINDVVMWRGNV